MAIDLQKLEQKFNALFEDENTVAEFEQWLEARNVKPELQQTQCTTSVFCEAAERQNKMIIKH